VQCDEKLEIQLLLQQYLREEHREEIYSNFEVAQTEEKNRELNFSSDINTLKQILAC
jgi:hypothetical protein